MLPPERITHYATLNYLHYFSHNSLLIIKLKLLTSQKTIMQIIIYDYTIKHS